MKYLSILLTCLILMMTPSCRSGKSTDPTDADYAALAERIQAHPDSLTQKDFTLMLDYLIDMYQTSIDDNTDENDSSAVTNYWSLDSTYWEKMNARYPYAGLFNATIADNSDRLDAANRQLQTELRSLVSLTMGV